MTMTRTVIVDTAAHKELKVLAVRFVKAIVAAIDELEHQADVTTKHRHAMTGVYVPHWQVEVGDHRVYYVFDADTVTVKAVRLKGNKRTEEVFKP